MSLFTDRELQKLRAERLARLATVDARGRPHVVPIVFQLDLARGTILLAGKGMGRSKKYRDVKATGMAAMVVDGVEGELPWGIEVRGRAEAVGRGGEELRAGVDPEFIRLRPTRIVAWGLDTDPFHPNAREVGQGRGAPD